MLREDSSLFEPIQDVEFEIESVFCHLPGDDRILQVSLRFQMA